MPSIGSTIQTTPLRALARAALLADHPVVGSGAEQPLADQDLAGPVGLGHDVDRAGLGARDLDALAAEPRRSARRPRARSYGEPTRPAGQRPSRGRAGRGDASGSTPAAAGSAPAAAPRGLGQQSAAQRSQHGRPAADRRPARPVSPRSTAARSTSRSRTIATNRASVPDVGTRTASRPEPVGGGQGLGVEVVDDLHVVGHEADRDQHHRRRPRRRRASRGGR